MAENNYRKIRSLILRLATALRPRWPMGANAIGNFASGTAVVIGGAALATSETIVDGLTFGGIAADAEIVGLAATRVQAGALSLDSNYGGMRGSLRSGPWTAATGFGVSRLYSGGARDVRCDASSAEVYACLHNKAGSRILQNVCR